MYGWTRVVLLASAYLTVAATSRGYGQGRVGFPPAQFESSSAGSRNFGTRHPTSPYSTRNISDTGMPAGTRQFTSQNRTERTWGGNHSPAYTGPTYTASADGLTRFADEPNLSRERQGAPPAPMARVSVPSQKEPPYQPPYSTAATNAGEPPAPFARGGNVVSAASNRSPVGGSEHAPPTSHGGEYSSASGTGRQTSGTLLGLLFSVALNVFLAWITWDTHNRYQDLVDDFDELQERRGEPRIDASSRTGSARRRTRDYDGYPLETSAEPSA